MALGSLVGVKKGRSASQLNGTGSMLPTFRLLRVQEEHGDLPCGQSPPAEARGLVSGLHRNSAYRVRRAALASSLDTSGRTDKTPVPIQSCRIRSVRMVMFLAPTKSAWSV